MVSKKKNQLLMGGWDLEIIVCHNSASLVMPKGDPRDDFSSPEPMTLASVGHFQTSSPLKPLGQLNSNFIWRLLRMGERKFVQMVLVTLPKWPPCPYRERSGLVLDSRPKGRGFEPHRRHCIVVFEQDAFILA